MKYEIKINEFEGPLDLLLHLIKKNDMNLYDISIEEITKQYLSYITEMESMNLTIASEYLVMAAELMEMKSSYLLPKPEIVEDDYEEDSRDVLIQKLIDYQQYKNISSHFKELEQNRKEIFTKLPENLNDYQDNSKALEETLDLTLLMDAFSKFLNRKEMEKPLETKITTKEYSVKQRSSQIRKILQSKSKVEFSELFDKQTKDYVIVTFLSVLSMAKKQELEITQENNFQDIYLTLRK